MWHPALAEVCGVQPWMMGDFRPREIDAMIQYLNEKANAANG